METIDGARVYGLYHQYFRTSFEKALAASPDWSPSLSRGGEARVQLLRPAGGR